MNRDDITRMAREAGFETAEEWDKFPNGFVQVVARFAALVAAAEREACSDICDQHASIEGIAQRCADAIRARGQA
ncbi:MAG: hypothetical protein EHM17_16035 [Verrucomicrobiaceae bacterium]|nr:MAG: hypothetical protein EHM17_16035 [Verrucomicrobiaceae bacterium]